MPSPTEALRLRISDRLAIELDDAALGLAVGEQLDPRALDVLSRLVDLATTDVLSFSARQEPHPEALIVFAFGNRVAADDRLQPGPVNLELAALADKWAQVTGLPVAAQWEVADEMVNCSIRVGAIELDDGSIEYLSTAGVAAQVRDLLDVDRVAVLSMADHAVRCGRTLERVGFSVGVPVGIELPSVYDVHSGQPWTRDRATYIAVDILARCLTAAV